MSTVYTKFVNSCDVHEVKPFVNIRGFCIAIVFQVISSITLTLTLKMNRSSFSLQVELRTKSEVINRYPEKADIGLL
jgi:hypothetical protein